MAGQSFAGKLLKRMRSEEKQDMDEYTLHVHTGSFFPIFKDEAEEKDYQRHAATAGLPTVRKYLARNLLPVATFSILNIWFLTNGAAMDLRDPGREIAYFVAAIAAGPLVLALRYAVPDSSVTGATFQLYANAVALVMVAFFFGGVTVFIRFGATSGSTAWDWLARGMASIRVRALVFSDLVLAAKLFIF